MWVAAAGATVVVPTRDDQADDVLPERVELSPLDVTSPDSWTARRHDVADFGRIDVL